MFFPKDIAKATYESIGMHEGLFPRSENGRKKRNLSERMSVIASRMVLFDLRVSASDGMRNETKREKSETGKLKKKKETQKHTRDSADAKYLTAESLLGRKKKRENTGRERDRFRIIYACA